MYGRARRQELGRLGLLGEPGTARGKSWLHPCGIKRPRKECPGPGDDTVRPHEQGKTRAKIAGPGGETEAASPAPSCPRAGGGGRESHLVAEDLGLMVGGWHRAGGGGGQQAAQARPTAGGGERGAQHAELSGA